MSTTEQLGAEFWAHERSWKQSKDYKCWLDPVLLSQVWEVIRLNVRDQLVCHSGAQISPNGVGQKLHAAPRGAAAQQPSIHIIPG